MPGAADVGAYARALRDFVSSGGNLVLTDGALAGLPALVPSIKASQITKGYYYAGWIDFEDGGNATYQDPLARGVNKEGTAEAEQQIGNEDYAHRHQTYEPVPIGYKVPVNDTSCTSDRCDSPNWVVDSDAWRAAGGRAVGRTFVNRAPEGTNRGPSAGVTGTSLGELKLGSGDIRIVGALLPQPTEANYHPFGLASYALTYTGYQVFENAVDHTRTATPPTVLGERKQRPLAATGSEGPLLGLLMLGVGAALTRRLHRAARA
jgi:hypothetical protein